MDTAEVLAKVMRRASWRRYRFPKGGFNLRAILRDLDIKVNEDYAANRMKEVLYYKGLIIHEAENGHFQLTERGHIVSMALNGV